MEKKRNKKFLCSNQCYVETKIIGYGKCMAREDFSSEVIFIRDQHNKKESSTKICRRRTFQDEVTDVKTLQQELVCHFLEEKGVKMLEYTSE